MIKLATCDLKLRERIQKQVRDEDNHKAQSAVIERAIWHEPVAAPKRKAGDAGRVLVRVVSYRRRLIDADNLCPKYFIDCLRYAGIIRDDSPQFIEVATAQEKVGCDLNARTEITVERILSNNDAG